MRSSGLRRLIHSFYALDSEHLWVAIEQTLVCSSDCAWELMGLKALCGCSQVYEVAVVTRPLRFRPHRVYVLGVSSAPG
jgi:hypothetical protein